jgi:hypothetical protein
MICESGDRSRTGWRQPELLCNSACAVKRQNKKSGFADLDEAAGSIYFVIREKRKEDRICDPLWVGLQILIP